MPYDPAVIVDAMRTNTTRFRELMGHAEKLGLDTAPLYEPHRLITEHVAALRRVVNHEEGER
jgi:hypothetical protein